MVGSSDIDFMHKLETGEELNEAHFFFMGMELNETKQRHHIRYLSSYGTGTSKGKTPGFSFLSCILFPSAPLPYATTPLPMFPPLPFAIKVRVSY